MATITKDMTILEVLQNHPQTVEVLQSLNLGCLGCIAASGESLEQGLSAHGLNVNEVLEKLNQAVA
jgi:hybrid cluster-associated redox disulfide protein